MTTAMGFVIAAMVGWFVLHVLTGTAMYVAYRRDKREWPFTLDYVIGVIVLTVVFLLVLSISVTLWLV